MNRKDQQVNSINQKWSNGIKRSRTPRRAPKSQRQSDDDGVLTEMERRIDPSKKGKTNNIKKSKTNLIAGAEELNLLSIDLTDCCDPPIYKKVPFF